MEKGDLEEEVGLKQARGEKRGGGALVNRKYTVRDK